jgi:hypothetical protein
LVGLATRQLRLPVRWLFNIQPGVRSAKTIDPDKVKAAFDKCVLKVTLLKRPKAAMAEKGIPISKN